MKTEVDHYPRVLLGLVDERGAEAAVRQLILNGPTDTFTELHRKTRLDLSVEALAVDPKWDLLFRADVEVIKKAQSRLENCGFLSSGGTN